MIDQNQASKQISIENKLNMKEIAVLKLCAIPFYYSDITLSNVDSNYSQGTKGSVIACWQCGALQMYLFLSVSLFILCVAAALHIAIEDSYDVEFFLTKSAAVSLGIPAVMVACLAIADEVASPQYSSLFLTSDSLTDKSALGCRIALPLRYAVVLAPQLLIMLTTAGVLYRLQSNILGEKYETTKLEKATKHLSFVHALMMVVVMFSINSAITATSVTSQDETLIYIYAAFNVAQALAIFYSIGFHSTPLIEYMTDSAKRRREALLQDIADTSFNDSDYGDYDFDHDSTESGSGYYWPATSSSSTNTRLNAEANLPESSIRDIIRRDSASTLESKRISSKRVSFSHNSATSDD